MVEPTRRMGGGDGGAWQRTRKRWHGTSAFPRSTRAGWICRVQGPRAAGGEHGKLLRLHLSVRGAGETAPGGSPRGLTVIGVPSQDFNQECRQQDSEDILRGDIRCGVPDGGHRACARNRGGAVLRLGARAKRWEPDWNFNKVLIGR